MADYIDKQKTLNVIFEIAENVINSLPSADVKPVRHGHWIETEDDTIHGYCSVCGWESHLYEDDVIGMPYCPNCGARMDGDRNDIR